MLEFLNTLDASLLSRIQFAFTISFHIIFPAFTIGLASWLAVVELLWLRTENPVFEGIYHHWVKIFAVVFGMGVVSGVVMSYEFGTNWSAFSQAVGNVLGPLLGFEVLTAFFLEASFLGIMLFGWGKVSKGMHFTATLLVAIGTVVSAFWILSANSWMHTPAGYMVGENGIFLPTNWLEIIFNPSFLYRFMHMILAAYITTAFVVGGISSWYLLRGLAKEQAPIMLAMAMFIIVLLPPLQIYIGDVHGLNTLKHQPAKIAAIEGIWETKKGVPLTLVGYLDKEKKETKYAVDIPKAASLILTHSFDGELKGLNEWPESDWPPLNITFWSFRVMVGIGLLMLLTGLGGIYLYFRGTLFKSRAYHRWLMIMAPSGFIALLAGWFVTEVGRQPYLVYGLLRTKDMVSPVTGWQVLLSLMAFIFAYIVVFGSGIYYIAKLIQKDPSRSAGVSTYYQIGSENPILWLKDQWKGSKKGKKK